MRQHDVRHSGRDANISSNHVMYDATAVLYLDYVNRVDITYARLTRP